MFTVPNPSPVPNPPAAMSPFPCWEDLQPELLGRIGDRLDLKCYVGARGACTAWRRALAPPSPALLVVADRAGRCRPSASSLPTRRSFELAVIAPGRSCIGASNGWLALCPGSLLNDLHTVFVLLNPVTGVEIALPPLIHETWVSKVVFAPSPSEDDFAAAAAAICGVDRIAYVTAGARRWAVLDPVRLAAEDQLTDVVYHDEGKVYCLTRRGDVHVLRLPERRRRKPATFEDPDIPESSVLGPPELIHFRPSRDQDQDQDQDQAVPMRIALLVETLHPFSRVPPEWLNA